MFSAKQIQQLGVVNPAQNAAGMKNSADYNWLDTGFLSKQSMTNSSSSLKGLSAFQILLMSMLDANGDMSQINKKFKGALRCSVKETSPNFLVTDGSYFLSAYFTKQSYKQFRSENSQLRVTDLIDVMVQINKWRIELVGDTSQRNFTSFGGIEMRMIIEQMDLKKDYKVELKKYPTNLYRDDKMKTAIQDFVSKNQRQILQDKLLFNKTEGLNQFNQANTAFESLMSGGPTQFSEQQGINTSIVSNSMNLKQHKVGMKNEAQVVQCSSMFSLSNKTVVKQGKDAPHYPCIEKFPFIKKGPSTVMTTRDIIFEELGKTGVEEMEKRENKLKKVIEQFEKKTASSRATPVQPRTNKTLQMTKEGKANVVTNITKASSKSHQIKKNKIVKVSAQTKALKSAVLKNMKNQLKSKKTIQSSKKEAKKPKANANDKDDDSVVKMTKAQMEDLVKQIRKETIEKMMKKGKK